MTMNAQRRPSRPEIAAIVEKLAAEGVLSGLPGSRLCPHDPETHDLLIVAATESVSDADIGTYAKALRDIL